MADLARCQGPDLTQGDTIRSLTEGVLAEAESTFALARWKRRKP